jgi:archaellin
VVGRLNGYEAAIEAGDIVSAAGFLAQAANQTVTPETVQQVNARLGFQLHGRAAQALADLARQQQ